MYKYQKPLNHTDIFLHHFWHSEKHSQPSCLRNGFTLPKTCEEHTISILRSKCQPGIKACTAVLAFWTATLNCRQDLVLTSWRGRSCSLPCSSITRAEGGWLRQPEYSQSPVGSIPDPPPAQNTNLSCSLSGNLCHPQSTALHLVYQQLGTRFNPVPVHHTLFYPNTNKVPQWLQLQFPFNSAEKSNFVPPTWLSSPVPDR